MGEGAEQCDCPEGRASAGLTRGDGRTDGWTDARVSTLFMALW